MDLSQSFAPLRHRQFALLWTGAFVSNIGTWMETVAVGILVTQATDQAGWTGLVAAAGFLPSAVFGPFGGALADRFHRKHILLATTTVQTGLATLLTVLAATGQAGPGVVTLIVLAAGFTMALGFPSYQALLPDLVPQEDLVGAVALSSAQWNLGRVIGPALAGIVISIGGYAWAFAVNAASFLAVIAVVLPLHIPPPVPREHPPILTSIADGMRYVNREPGLRVVVRYMALNTLLAAPFIALVPAMAITVLDAGGGGTAALVTAQGAGAVLMAFALGPLTHRLGSRRVMLLVLWTLPAALVAYACAPGLPASIVAIFVVGFLYLGALSSFTSIAQLRAPTEVRGRVLSVLMVLLGALYPLGSILQGALADRYGLRAVTAGAAVAMAAVLVVARMRRPGFADALDAVADPDLSPEASGP